MLHWPSYQICERKVTRNVQIWYLIVNAHKSSNIFLGRPSFNTLGAIVSTYYLAMKLPSALGDIIIVHMDKPIAKKCYVDSLSIRSWSPRHRRVHNIERVKAEEMVDLDSKLNDEVKV